MLPFFSKTSAREVQPYKDIWQSLLPSRPLLPHEYFEEEQVEEQEDGEQENEEQADGGGEDDSDDSDDSDDDSPLHN